MEREMNELSSKDQLQFVNKLDSDAIVANISTTNDMYTAMIYQRQEKVVAAMRKDYEKERMNNQTLFQQKMKDLQDSFDQQLGELKYLPSQVNEMNIVNSENQIILHKLRIHFEQLRMACMLEHKTMEGQLRKVHKNLQKLNQKKKQLDERDSNIKMKVTNSLREIWEPRVEHENNVADEKLKTLRDDSKRKMSIFEDVIIQRLEKDYGKLKERGLMFVSCKFFWNF
jgi:hypothetical protein